jgi:hypothetical protein
VDAHVECGARLSADCDIGCEQEGVLECNGEFIDRKDLDAAVAWVKENITVEVDFEGDAECHGNSCSAEGSCEVKCAVGAPGKSSPLSLFVILSVVSMLFFLNRRR